MEDTLFGVVHPGMHLEKAKRANRQLGFRCLGEIDSFFDRFYSFLTAKPRCT